MNFTESMGLAEQAFDTWAAKDHNKKWARKIDGTPIRNDLTVVFATALVEYHRLLVPRCASCGTLMRRNCPECEKYQSSVSRLAEANRFAEQNYPLMRCVHGQALIDHGGNVLEPPCGCQAVEKES